MQEQGAGVGGRPRQRCHTGRELLAPDVPVSASVVSKARTAAEAVWQAPESARFVVPHLQLPAGAESAPKECGFRLAFFLPRCVRLAGAHPAA